MVGKKRERIGGDIPPVPPRLRKDPAIYGYIVESSNRDHFREIIRPQRSDLMIMDAILASADRAGVPEMAVFFCHVDTKDIVEGNDGPIFIMLAMNNLRRDGTRKVVDFRPRMGNFDAWIESLELNGPPKWMRGEKTAMRGANL
ncbi:uncharacterized protein BXZ73DRAFT_102304 [Epithele typhae]|uniref:uncharacterized protein n=1 Tax=Epithele typhae TaxID=378194 RepID=UPI0020078DC5|nr:uncharacterized protein BXZ73DRAFT_102304 [Epithele typhae]KAH9928462.1 hypothetical protein BXZ73DRAFT_102304 [Epithele typhae]